MTAPPLLTAMGVRVVLGPARSCGLSVSVSAGNLVQLAGPSGCGKTTLLRALARLQPRTAGTLALAGEPADRIPPTVWRRRVAYVAQRPAMLPGTVEENLHAGSRVGAAAGQMPPTPRVEAWCTSLGLSATLRGQDARTVSGGEAARIALVRALLTNPDILLLDECTAALDADAAVAFVDLVHDYVREAARAALVVAHQPEVWKRALCGTAAVEAPA